MKAALAFLGVIFGVLFAAILTGLIFAAFLTFVLGLFIVFPFTLINVLKVWAALIAFNLVFAGFRRTK